MFVFHIVFDFALYPAAGYIDAISHISTTTRRYLGKFVTVDIFLLTPVAWQSDQ